MAMALLWVTSITHSSELLADSDNVFVATVIIDHLQQGIIDAVASVTCTAVRQPVVVKTFLECSSALVGRVGALNAGRSVIGASISASQLTPDPLGVQLATLCEAVSSITFFSKQVDGVISTDGLSAVVEIHCTVVSASQIT